MTIPELHAIAVGREPGSGLTAKLQEGAVPQSYASPVRKRIAENFLRLRELEQQRAVARDPEFGRAEQRRMVNRELLDLELQAVEDEIESICREAADRIRCVTVART